MNNFIRHGNKVLLIATIPVGFGAWTSDIDRANAIIIIGCGDNIGNIGTGPNCVGPVNPPRFSHTACQLGSTPSGASVCCSYTYSKYYCTDNTGATIYLGEKGDLVGGEVGGNCTSTNFNNQLCISPYSHPNGGPGSAGQILDPDGPVTQDPGLGTPSGPITANPGSMTP